MAGIKHKTRAPGTNIKSSAVWGEDHEIEAGAIDADALASNAVTEVKIAAGSVTTDKIADDAVTTAKIADDSVTNDKLATKMYFFVKSGTSPITFAHNIGQEPTGVVATPNALQPYSWSYDKDATNIKIYHNGFGSLTFNIIAWV